MYSHILLATDGSEVSAKAVTHAISLAKILSAKLTVLNASELWSAYAVAAEVEAGVTTAIEDYERAAKVAADKVLGAVKDKAKAAGIDCDTVHVPDRRPGDAIVETADKVGCDLIVMGSHGRRGLDRLLLGSQAVDVLTHAKVPVLVIR